METWLALAGAVALICLPLYLMWGGPRPGRGSDTGADAGGSAGWSGGDHSGSHGHDAGGGGDGGSP